MASAQILAWLGSAHRNALTQRLDDIFLTKTKQEWIDIMEGVIPCAPVFEVDEALHTPFVQQNKIVSIPYTRDHKKQQKIFFFTPPLSFSDANPITFAPAPLYGEHSNETLTELGLSAEDIEGLEQEKIVRKLGRK